MKIEILRTHGYSCLKDVALPITVNATEIYNGCFDVYGEEFRPYTTSERMPDANKGKGLLHSFYGEGSCRVLKENK